jgi:cytochrome bd ubiquinol oxidase subunit II
MSLDTLSLDLPFIWACLLAVAVFMYVVMDGFDLGVGILFPAVHGRTERDLMVNSIAPVWDGNETWLVLGGAGMLAVFPLAYATLLPAFYMPLILMLLALIFRGVAFEMRFRALTEGGRRWWDRSFSWGSYAATIFQGICLGAYVQGVHVENRAYAGGWWDWLSPFSVLTAVALVAGYGLLGACWLIWKTHGELQARFRKIALRLAVATLGFIAAVSVVMLFDAPFRERWLTFPAAAGAAVVPILVLALAWLFFKKVRGDGEVAPFLCALGLFALSYAGLGISLWPMIVPPHVTIWEAAAPPSTQAFLLVGAVVLIPIILLYTAYVYWLFRGKVHAGVGYH